MTGPEHYREAERALRCARQEADYDTPAERYFLACAQVHALLAFAAATATQPGRYSTGEPEWTEWAEVASVEHARRNDQEGPRDEHASTGRAARAAV